MRKLVASLMLAFVIVFMGATAHAADDYAPTAPPQTVTPASPVKTLPDTGNNNKYAVPMVLLGTLLVGGGVVAYRYVPKGAK